MISVFDYVSDLSEAIGRGWNRFWFTPADPRPSCVLRIAVGVLAALHLLSLGIEEDRWYGNDGLLPPAAVASLIQLASAGQEANYHYSYLGYLNDTQLSIVHALAVAIAAAFACGFVTRITGILTLVNVLAFVHRVPQVAGLVEPVMAFLLAYLCVAPSGACLSLDALLRRRKGGTQLDAIESDEPQPSISANIGLRLIQVHLAMFYLMMGLMKLYGDAWWEGNAIWLLLAQTESRPMKLTGLRHAGQFGVYVINAWTLSIVYFELAFAVLIWNRWARPLLLALSLVVWTSIIVATGQLLLGLTMIAASAAFLPLRKSAR